MSEIDDFATGDNDGGFDVEAYNASIRAVLPHLYSGGDIGTEKSNPNDSFTDTVAQSALKLAKDKKL